MNLLLKKLLVLDSKLIKSSSQSKTNGCICNIKVIISLFFDDTTFRVYAHYEFQCLSFFMRCSSSSYSNLCVGFHVNLFNVCEKIARPHTRTACGTHAHIKCGTPAHLHVVRNARPHAHIFFFSVLLWKEWVLHNIMHSFLLGYYLFFFIFFDKCWKWQRETWEKINKLISEFSFLESVTKSSN